MSFNCICKDFANKRENSSNRCFCELWLFQNFTSKEYKLLESIGRQRVFKKGESIFCQEDDAKELFLLKSGRIKLSKYFEDGSEVILDYRGAGDIFGEHVFIDNETYPLSAWAAEKCITCGTNKKDLERVILENPNIGLIMLKNISRKLVSVTNRLESSSISNLEERLFNVLLNIAVDHGIKREGGVDIPFPLTHEELGFVVNAHRVSITKAIKNLTETDRVKRVGKFFFIPNRVN